MCTHVDYNECVNDNGAGCKDNCSNTLGSFVCTCEDGTVLPEGQTDCDGMYNYLLLEVPYNGSFFVDYNHV